MRFFKSIVAMALFVFSIGTASAAIEVETARGKVSVEKPLTEQIAVYEVAALDTLSALGIYPKGTSAKVAIDYLAPVYERAQIVGTLFEPDLEKLNATKPEMIITGGRMAAKYDQVRKIAPVLDMTTKTMSVERALELLDTYGKLFDKQDKAAELAQNLKEEIAKTKALIQDKGTALMLGVSGQKVSSYGINSRFGYLFKDFGWTLADPNGGENSHGSPVSFEFIREVNPDWLIVMDRNRITGDKSGSAQAILDNALVRETKAFKNQRIIYLDDSSYLAPGGYQQMMLELKLLREAVSQ